jgi:hypothetical protein
VQLRARERNLAMPTQIVGGVPRLRARDAIFRVAPVLRVALCAGEAMCALLGDGARIEPVVLHEEIGDRANHR